MKQVPRNPPNNPLLELAHNELKVLQHTIKCKFIVELVDWFEEDEYAYLISKHSNKTLRNYIAHRKVERFSEEETCKFIGQIAFCLDKLHAKFIMHRDLSVDSLTVKIKREKERIYVTLCSFNFAYLLKKNHTV